MNILIDMEHDGAGNVLSRQWLITDVAPGNMVQDPTNALVQITHLAMLGKLSGNPVLQAATGYAVVNKLPGEPLAISRWQRVINASKSGLAEPALAALNLT